MKFFYKFFSPQHPNQNQGQLNCSETHNCYVIDNNGYIILSSSENTNHTGRFFGEVEGDTMKALVDEGVFKANTVYDFQAVCKQRQTKAQSSFGTILSTVGVYHLLYENVFLLKKNFFLVMNV